MTFDKQTNRLARAHDAVDRLREVQQKIIQRQAAAERRRDYAVRAVMLAALFLVIYAAYKRL